MLYKVLYSQEKALIPLSFDRSPIENMTLAQGNEPDGEAEELIKRRATKEPQFIKGRVESAGVKRSSKVAADSDLISNLGVIEK